MPKGNEANRHLAVLRQRRMTMVKRILRDAPVGGLSAIQIHEKLLYRFKQKIGRTYTMNLLKEMQHVYSSIEARRTETGKVKFVLKGAQKSLF